MNKYFDMFVQDKCPDIESMDVNETTPYDRYWIFACLASKYAKEKNKGNLVTCMLHFKRLGFVSMVCAKMKNKLGEEYIDPKYKDYLFPNENYLDQKVVTKKLMKLDEFSSGINKAKKKIALISVANILISGILVVILYFLAKLELVWSICIGAVMAVILIGIMTPKMFRREIQKLTISPDLEYDDFLEPWFEKDNDVDGIFQDELMMSVAKAKNDFEIEEIIRKLPKK